MIDCRRPTHLQSRYRHHDAIDAEPRSQFTLHERFDLVPVMLEIICSRPAWHSMASIEAALLACVKWCSMTSSLLLSAPYQKPIPKSVIPGDTSQDILNRVLINHSILQGIEMYASLLLPWSDDLSQSEQQYKSAGLVKTKGTIFLLPPPENLLRQAYNAPPRPKTRMSSGAVALCKHFERGGCSADSSRGRDVHPFWHLPVGSNENKSGIAGDILEGMLRGAVWRNVIWLHEGVAVYEMRNAKGYGMRWTLDLAGEVSGMMDPESDEGKNFKILKTTFRGFLEPIEGLDHELDGAQELK